MCGFSSQTKRFMHRRGAEVIYSGIPRALNFLFSLITGNSVANSRVHALWRVRVSYHTIRVLFVRSPQFTRAFFLSFISSRLCPVFSCFEACSQILRKATVGFVKSVCLSVRMEQPGSQLMDFLEILYLNIFRKSVEKIRVLLKSEENNRHFTWRPIYIFDHISLSFS